MGLPGKVLIIVPSLADGITDTRLIDLAAHGDLGVFYICRYFRLWVDTFNGFFDGGCAVATGHAFNVESIHIELLHRIRELRNLIVPATNLVFPTLVRSTAEPQTLICRVLCADGLPNARLLIRPGRC